MLACWFQQTKCRLPVSKSSGFAMEPEACLLPFCPCIGILEGQDMGGEGVCESPTKNPGVSFSRVLPISRRILVFLEILRKFLEKKKCLLGLSGGQDTRSSPHSLSAELLRNGMSKTAKILMGFWRKSASCLWLKIYNCNCRWGKASKKVDNDGWTPLGNAARSECYQLNRAVANHWEFLRISPSWWHRFTSNLHWLKTKPILYSSFIAAVNLDLPVPKLWNAFWVIWELFTEPTDTKNCRSEPWCVWTEVLAKILTYE